MIITKKALPRRTFLKGVGAALALPLLDAMIPAATALAKTPAQPVPRLGFVFIPMGTDHSRWTPKETGRCNQKSNCGRIARGWGGRPLSRVYVYKCNVRRHWNRTDPRWCTPIRSRTDCKSDCAAVRHPPPMMLLDCGPFRDNRQMAAW